MDYCDVTEYACHAGHATPLRYTLNIVHSVNAHTVQLVSSTVDLRQCQSPWLATEVDKTLDKNSAQ